MKTLRTLLLCILALGLIMPVIAQQTVNSNNLGQNVKVMTGYKEAMQDLKLQVKNQMKAVDPDHYFYGNRFNPSRHQKANKDNYYDQILANPTGTILGSCWYDQQTSGNMPRQITNYSASSTDIYFNVAATGSASGTAGKADFTVFGQTAPTYASMGSYYQFLDYTGNDIVPQATWKRIEKFASKSGSIFNFNDGKVGVSSFLFPLQLKSLQQSIADIGEDNFVTDSVPNTMTFFPRSVADGQNNVHSIFSHRITGETEFDQIGYKKGSNGGKVWSDEVLMSGPNALGGALPTAASFETYAIDAEGNNVVFAYIDKNLNFIYRKSSDNGNTWGQATLLWSPEYDTIYTKKDPSGTYYGWTDSSAMGPGLIMDAIVDDNGDMHFAVNVMIVCHVGEVQKNTQGQWAWVSGTDSVVWGKKYYPSIGFLYINVPKDTTVKPSYVLGAPPSDGNFTPAQGVYTPFSYTHIELNDSMPGTFCVADPQLGYDVDGNIYMTYTSIRDSMNSQNKPDSKALVHSQTGDAYSFYNRHIFITKYDKLAKLWSKPVCLTPNQWDCGYGSLAKKLVKKKGETRFPMVYTADQEPTNWIGFSRIFNFTSEPQLYTFPFRMQDYTAGNAVNDDPTMNATINVVPNPVSDNSMIYFSNPKSGSITVEIFNLLGQKVQNVFNGFADAGMQSFQVNGSNLDNGTYLCKINANGTTASQMIVISK